MVNKPFVNGIWIKTVQTKFGEMDKLEIKSLQFIEWLNKNTNKNGYCYIDIKMSRKGSKYLELNDYEPSEKKSVDNQQQQNLINNKIDGQDDDLPF